MKFKNHHLLIIGGTGFIGYHLASNGIKLGFKVTSVSLNEPILSKKVNGVRYIQLDLKSLEKVDKFKWDNYHFVINLVGYIGHDLFKNGGRKYIDQHFISLLNIIQSLPRKNLKKFIQIGSSDEYGDNISPQKEIMRENPISSYSLAKVSATHFLQMVSNTENFPSVITRLFLTYGPGQNDFRFIPQVIKGCLNGNKFPTSMGVQLRDFLYIEDTVEAIFNLLTTENINGEIFNIASGQPTSIRVIIEKIRNLVKNGTPDYGKVQYRKGENMSLFADISKIQKFTSWKPKISLDKGLLNTINWYKKNNF